MENRVHNIHVHQIHAGQINRNRQNLLILATSLRQELINLPIDKFIQHSDVAALIQCRDKVPRKHNSMCWRYPADQSLRRYNFLRLRIYNRLIIYLKLFIPDRVLQINQRNTALFVFDLHLLIINGIRLYVIIRNISFRDLCLIAKIGNADFFFCINIADAASCIDTRMDRRLVVAEMQQIHHPVKLQILLIH